jgi:N-acyl-phosphatidylethanolamine-hydrolysing phospholipase D
MRLFHAQVFDSSESNAVIRLNQITQPVSCRVRFRNPPGSPSRTAGLADFVPFFIRRAVDATPPVVPPGHVLPETEAVSALRAAGPESLTWLGHAAFLLRTGGKTILTDPFLSDRASPFAALGPKRYVRPGLPFASLPRIDAIVISHDHYDHLDARTIERFSSKTKIAAFVPTGLGDFFRSRGYRDVRELGWEESARVGEVVFTALPCIHFSGRTPLDRNATLWASWSIVSPLLKAFFAGDTGYGPVFAETGARHGPFDLALLPIGAYEPASIMRPVHCDPEEAVAAGSDLRAKTLVAMHWGTVVLTDEPPFEPPGRFRAAANRAGWPDDRVWVMRIGETRALTR